MMNLSDGASFATKTVQHVTLDRSFGERDFDRQLAIQLGVFRQEHRAHASLAQRF